ncbi:GIY-YIG nuclease family protein [Arenibacter certesii]|uniref:Excinuclease cho n=1 Tax=Arenibacter certesii TaxID=228955 RepID=A0A918J114_9FLAO|nr:GIY-YIG nuclease family protein [Arenibacter certesii]GGW42451.1 hypothetical protein GCM10007383_28760 [Arenibacter certesii]
MRQNIFNDYAKNASVHNHIDWNHFDRLPSRPGIYKFQDKAGHTVYVGKAKNIKKRVLSHFRCKSEKETLLCHDTYSIDFELTGNELVALLLEADLIKKLLPKYNTIQKHHRTAFHIVNHYNKAGILQLDIEIKPILNEPTEVFYTKGAAKSKLESLCEQHTLCPKFSGLQRGKGKCSNIKFPSCTGICSGDEEIYNYNERVYKAIDSLHQNASSYIILERGRSSYEQCVVLILEGVYRGFGYIDNSQQISHIDEILDLIQPRKNSYHTSSIITKYTKNNTKRVHYLTPENNKS